MVVPKGCSISATAKRDVRFFNTSSSGNNSSTSTNTNTNNDDGNTNKKNYKNNNDNNECDLRGSGVERLSVPNPHSDHHSDPHSDPARVSADNKRAASYSTSAYLQQTIHRPPVSPRPAPPPGLLGLEFPLASPRPVSARPRHRAWRPQRGSVEPGPRKPLARPSTALALAPEKTALPKGKGLQSLKSSSSAYGREAREGDGKAPALKISGSIASAAAVL